MKNFAMIGVGGFVAPRHLKAIKDTNNKLICALDKSDSVGIMDSFSENVFFFTEFERFDRYAEKIKRDKEKKIDYVSICSPNYLHDAHVRFALRIGADAICEKPIVLNPWNLEALKDLEKETGKKIYTILQLRLHPSILKIKEQVEKASSDKKYEIDLTYITSRGRWYHSSWKGDESKSGGVATNIGIHFFDMLLWIFGDLKHHELYDSDKKKMSGYLELEKANIRWFLSIDKNDVPENLRKEGKRTFRSILIDEEEVEFSDGFEDLHTRMYEEILAGRGLGIEEARPAINLLHEIRNANAVESGTNKMHPFLVKVLEENDKL